MALETDEQRREAKEAWGKGGEREVRGLGEETMGEVEGRGLLLPLNHRVPE